MLLRRVPADRPRPQSADEGDTVLAGAFFGVLTQVVTASFTAALTLFLVRALGADGYGLFALGMSVLSIGLLVADAAFAASAGRFIADRRADPAGVRDVVAAALRLKLVAAFGVGAALALLADVVAAAYDKPALAGPLRAFAISLVAESILMLWSTTFMALRRLALSAKMVLAESFVEAGASIGFVVLGAGVTGAALGRAAGYGVGAVLGGLLVARVAGRAALRLRGVPRDVGTDIRRYARPLFATNAAYTVYGAVDIQLIALLLTSSAVGVWSAPMRLVLLLGYISLAVAGAVAPRMSRAGAGGADVPLFLAAIRWLLILHVAIVVTVVVWADPIVHVVLGDEFEDSVVVLQALGPMILLLAISPLASMTANFLGLAGKRLPIVLGSVVVNVVIDLALLPVIGVPGAAIGTSVAYLIYVPAHLWLCRRELGFSLRPLAVTGLRTLLAGALMALVLLVFGTADLAAWQLVAGAVLGTAVFAATLLATRELTGADLDLLRRFRRGRAI